MEEILNWLDPIGACIMTGFWSLICLIALAIVVYIIWLGINNLSERIKKPAIRRLS